MNRSNSIGNAGATRATIDSSNSSAPDSSISRGAISSNSSGSRGPHGSDDESKCPEELMIHDRHYRRNFIAFWILGFVNNFHYCLVLSAADQMATDLNMKKFVALEAWANVFFGLFVRILNAFVFNRWSYKLRMILAGVQTLIGLAVVSAAPYIGDSDGFRFTLLLLGIVAIGNGSSYGESVSLGYIELFPSRLVGGWSSGTGMSGVMAALIYIGLSEAKLTNTAIFMISAPFVLVYWFAYFVLLRVPFQNPVTGTWEAQNNWAALSWKQLPKIELTSAARHNSNTAAGTTPNERQQLLDEGRRSPFVSTSSATSSLRTVPLDFDDRVSAHPGGSINGPGQALHAPAAPTSGSGSSSCWTCAIWWSDFKRDLLPDALRLNRLTLFNNINLMLVYVFEYAVQFVAPFSFPCDVVKKSDNFLLKQSFVITQFCYQIGVLCSRSSLACIRIRRVELLTIAQALNAILWLVQSKTLMMSSSNESEEIKYAIGLFVWMVFVGFFGGASYVNVFYNVLEQTKRPEAVVTPSAVEDDLDADKRATIVSVDHHEDAAIMRQRLKLERQLSMNIGSVYATLGITGGSLVDVIFANTILTRSC